MFNLSSLVLSVKCVSGRLGVVLPVPRAPLRWKTGLPRKVINRCFVLAGLCSWESAGLARPQTPLRAKLVLASEEDPAQGVFSPLWSKECLGALKPGRIAACSGACAMLLLESSKSVFWELAA